MTFINIYFYVMIAMVTGVFSLVVVDEHAPPGSTPALAFTIGLLWPISIVVGVAWFIWRAGVGVFAGFVALIAWRRARIARRP